MAAFMVFFNHLNLVFNPHFFITLQSVFYTGVSLFFVLSGFLIIYRYNYIAYSTNRASTYFVNRFARIYPVYFLILTIVILINRNFDLIYLLQNYTLTHNLFFLFDSHGLAIQPTWSLTVEECFYLLAPFIILLIKKFNVVVPFILVLLIYFFFLFIYADGDLFSDKGFLLSVDSFFGRALDFFAGIYLALLIMRKEKAGSRTRYKKLYTAVGIIGIAAVFVPLMLLNNKDQLTQHSLFLLFNNLLLPIPVTVFYYGLITEKTVIAKLLSSKFFKLFGRSSYAFYVLHIPVIDYIAKPYIKPLFGENYYNLYVIVTFLLTLALSILLFLFYEEPANKFLKKILSKKSKVQVKTVVAE